MKARLLTPLSVIAILATLGLGGAWLPTAQAQPVLSPAGPKGPVHTIFAPRSNPTLAQPDPTTQSRLQTTFGQMPLYFIENRGQLDDRVAYYVQGSDKTLYFTAEGVTIALAGSSSSPEEQAAAQTSRQAQEMFSPSPSPLLSQGEEQRWVLKLEFIGASPDVRPIGQDLTETIISYFKGRPDQWQTALPTYARLVYPDLWPGIDLVYSGTVNQLKYKFIVRPGADPGQIRLAYRGATSVALNAAGQLEMSTPLGNFHDDTPVAYQEVDGRQVNVPVAYALEDAGRDALAGHLYGFRVGAYDPTRPLVLDPTVLVYAGYVGGSGRDEGYDVAVDSVGNAYVTGWTYSTEATFPITIGPDVSYNGGSYDAFVAKIRADGTGLAYAGYIGGSRGDYGNGISVDSVGNAYVVGWTSSSESSFPVAIGPDLTYNGGTYDAFVAKIRADGTGLVYAGYIGGSGSDEGHGIAVDSAGNTHIAGYTASTEATFPVTVGPDLTYNGGSYDAFVTKVRADGMGLIYAGYIGGSGTEAGNGIAVDSTGDAYVTGYTWSSETSFPVTGGPDLTFNLGYADAFVAKIRSDGAGLLYAGYVGGSGSDTGYSIAVDGTGNAYICGYTSSSEVTFPVIVGPDLTRNGDWDAFVAKIGADGTGLIYAGYIGGANEDQGHDIAVDSAGSAYIAGWTSSDEATFPVSDGPDLTYNSGQDAFVAKVTADGTGLVYAGYIGGSDADRGHGIAIDSDGNAYVTGYTWSDESTFPASSGPDLTHNGYYDAFVAKVGDVSDAIPPAAITTLFASTGSASGTVDLTWISPGDDGTTGTASAYIVRYADSAIVSEFGWLIATDVSGEPTPQLAGSSESMNVSGLTPGQTYYFAIRTQDEVPNLSSLSNSPSAAAAGDDITPPAAITDLVAPPGSTPGTVDVTWTAPGDDGSGGGLAIQYDIRYDSTPINESNWASATQVNGEPTPGSPGDIEQMTLCCLTTGTRWYFAMKVADEASNWSGLSNVPSLQDIGFRSNTWGYHFPNPEGVNYGDYTINDMRRMFGDDAVCRMVGPICISKPTARQWNRYANSSMDGGRCDGMASTSLRFFKGLDNPADFQPGANLTYDLQLYSVRRHIAYYFVEQLTAPVCSFKEQMRQLTPTLILNQLRLAMSDSVPDPTTLFVRPHIGAGTGHTITPYAIEERGNGVHRVWVYDNEHPDDGSHEANRYVVITTTNNTWSYDLDVNTTWGGDASTHTLGIVPISKYDEQPVCPWCEGGVVCTFDGTSCGQIWLIGRGHLLITDLQGRRIGYVGNQFVNEIPDAYESTVGGEPEIGIEPIYIWPLSGTYSILLDGQTLTQTEAVSVTQFGPGYVASVGNMTLEPTSRNRLMFASDGTQLAYQSSDDNEAELTLAMDGDSESNQFQIKGADVMAGQVVTLTVDADNGQLVFNNRQSNGGEYDLQIVQVSISGEQWFVHAGVVISATDTHFANYGAWDGSGPMMLQVDHGSNGTIDETWELDNQAIQMIYLPIILK